MTGKFSRGGAPGERDDSSGAGRRERRVRPPLDEIVLGEMALAYAARFATTRSRLVTYPFSGTRCE